MKHILDTNVVLWFLNGEKITANTRDLITNSENYISVASLWEVAIKMNIGKYRFNGGFTAFTALVKSNGFSVLPIKEEYLERLFVLPFIHRDPFDRLIIATAKVENLLLIASDESIQKYDVDWIW
jgi:PIN domain nuclease of toxin-antitoxin system